MTALAELDPLAEMAERARRIVVEQRAAESVSSTRARLVLGRDSRACFFASLALRLKPKADWTIETAATDGRRLLYNPDFWLSLSQDAQVAVLIHEVLHCAGAHFARRGGRDPTRFNIAADLAINPMIRDGGYSLPSDCLWPRDYQLAEGLTAEEYYDRLPNDPGDPDGQPGDDPGGCGAVIDSPDPAQGKAMAADWQIGVAQAAEAAKRRGDLPADMQRWIGETLAPSLPWTEILRRFVSSAARNDYSWSRPNRRFIWQGMYLPGVHSEALGDVVLVVDCSGSTRDALDRFGGEASGVLEAYDCTATIVYHDSIVQHVQHWTPSDGPIRLEPRGGGGTDHRPVFQWLADSGSTPAVVVLLTDMCSSFPADSPMFPVLWVSTEQGHQAPFGELVEMR